jgi:hypothetical protein
MASQFATIQAGKLFSCNKSILRRKRSKALFDRSSMRDYIEFGQRLDGSLIVLTGGYFTTRCVERNQAHVSVLVCPVSSVDLTGGDE